MELESSVTASTKSKVNYNGYLVLFYFILFYLKVLQNLNSKPLQNGTSVVRVAEALEAGRALGNIVG